MKYLIPLFLSGCLFGQTAVIKTNPHPSWGNTKTWRSGQTNGLDGTGSTGGFTGYHWTCASFDNGSGSTTCPPGTNIVSATSGTTNVTGVIDGEYTFQLCDGMNAHCGTQIVGARNCDANGVLHPSDNHITQMFGPIICWGWNPEKNQDINHVLASQARSTVHDAYAPPPWDTPVTGTASYQFITQTGTTINQGSGTLGPTDATITVSDATQLDLATFPTLIYVSYNRYGAVGGSFEVIEICSAVGNVLTPCYNGRGYRYGAPNHALASSWVNGTLVTQHKVTGSGTSFLSTFNPLGAGWSGQTISTAGTCSVNHNSGIITGSGTNWTSGANLNKAILIQGHHSGVAFTWFSYVNSVTSTTLLGTLQVYPVTADDETGLTCSTLSPDLRFMVLHHKRCGGGGAQGCVDESYPYDGSMYVPLEGCESNTDCYFTGGRDPDSVLPGYSTCLTSPPYQNTLMECAIRVSYMDGEGATNDFGQNYYDEVLADMVLYIRSGFKYALVNARKIGGVDGTNNLGYNFWPEIQQGSAGAPRHMSAMGSWAMLLFDGKSKNIQGMRGLASSTLYIISTFTSCDVIDLREVEGYPLGWLAMAALWDPDPSLRATWKNGLDSWYTTYNSCARTGSGVLANSWYTSSLFDIVNGGLTTLSMTVGSKIATGSNIPAGLCGTTPSASGTGTFTPGSDNVTGSGFVTGGGRVLVTDGTLGVLPFGYSFVNSGNIHLSGKFPSTAGGGTLSWRIDTDSHDSQFSTNPPMGTLVIGNSPSDGQLTKSQSCTWNNSGQVTLDNNWDGTAGTNYAWRSSLHDYTAIGGRLTQPFFLNILSISLRLCSLVGGTTGDNCTILMNAIALWEKTYGIDPLTGGTYYGRIGPGYEPIYDESSVPAIFFRNPGGSFSSSSTGIQSARDISGEMQSIPYISFKADPSIPNRDSWDTFYQNIWSDTNGSQVCQGSSGYWVTYKYYGFCFGIGFSSQWPAAYFGELNYHSISGTRTVTGTRVIQ